MYEYMKVIVLWWLYIFLVGMLAARHNMAAFSELSSKWAV